MTQSPLDIRIDENIRQRVIKEITVKFLVAGIPVFGLSQETIETTIKMATMIFDYNVPAKQVSKPDRGGNLHD